MVNCDNYCAQAVEQQLPNEEVQNGQVINNATVIKNEKVQKALAKLPCTGVLGAGRAGSNSYVLWLEKNCTDELFEILTENEVDIKKGSYDLDPHVSVIRARVGDPIIAEEDMPEVGRTYKFEVQYLASVIPTNEADATFAKAWIVVLEAKELEDIRTSRGLTPLLQGHHKYHISVAIRYKEGC
ncbi:MAG: hypothetical protein JSR46_12230 [Verrucomicrobia bacterium]|nr:hypothetical protein [Verrucomicrobiota bacterium]